MVARVAVMMVALSLGAGCSALRPKPKLDSPEAAEKIPAIRQAVQRHDLTAAPQLVADLDSEDPAVRLYANQALVRLTGKNFGFRYYDSEEKRKEAVAKWQQWLSTQN